MKSFAILALAAMALAAPSDIEARTGNPPSNPSCAAPKKTICCNGLIGGILCTVGILGAGTCNDQAYCCDNSGGLVVGGLIALDALNCVNVDIL
jgi:hypothetical protein